MHARIHADGRLVPRSIGYYPAYFQDVTDGPITATGSQVDHGSGRSVAIGKETAGCFYGGSLDSDRKRHPKIDDKTYQGAIRLITGSGAEDLRWFALQVRTRWESSTTVLLSGKGYETLLPTYQAKKRWNGKVKRVTAPLFPGYVFCRFDALKRLPILITPGVISVVGRGRVPFPVNDGEIAAIQTIVTSGFQAEPWPYLEVGQKIRIEGDSFQGLEGILIQFKGYNRIVVSVSLLRRSVALELDRDCVRPLTPARTNVDPVPSHALLQGVVA